MNAKRAFAALALILLAGLALYFVFLKTDAPETPILTLPSELWRTTGPDGSTVTDPTTIEPTSASAATTTTTTTKTTTTTEKTTKATTTTAKSPQAVYAFAGVYEGIEPAIASLANPYLVLVNRHYALPPGHRPALAVCVPGYQQEMERTAAAQYKKMYDAALKDGAKLTPYSGYRSTERQKGNFERLIKTHTDRGLTRAQAVNLAAQEIMPPNCSEHEAGLAMDIWDTRNAFKDTKEYKWLIDHAHEYGFILRYPANKMDITLVTYEPWHWRYVGVDAAAAMKASGQCLEEYLGRL